MHTTLNVPVKVTCPHRRASGQNFPFFIVVGRLPSYRKVAPVLCVENKQKRPLMHTYGQHELSQFLSTWGCGIEALATDKTWPKCKLWEALFVVGRMHGMHKSSSQLLKVDWQLRWTDLGLARKANASFIGQSVARHSCTSNNSSNYSSLKGSKRGSLPWTEQTLQTAMFFYALPLCLKINASNFLFCFFSFFQWAWFHNEINFTPHPSRCCLLQQEHHIKTRLCFFSAPQSDLIVSS